MPFAFGILFCDTSPWFRKWMLDTHSASSLRQTQNDELAVHAARAVFMNTSERYRMSCTRYE
eukprot:4827803-Prymnesium_polylepis.1